ncbi:hypothetical protein BJ875DRAFT_445512 [Amylocarpus encephaloides]|uniref:Uncharacterized protein n=1 Tax=Amylocarpus encephaloides TaxID=45428 RepID=A0A9P7YA88_9HELO|nr:hypothetical protein BJ875DRAFT_445512 [Amylocarpus encephaloides]
MDNSTPPPTQNGPPNPPGIRLNRDINAEQPVNLEELELPFASLSDDIPAISHQDDNDEAGSPNAHEVEENTPNSSQQPLLRFYPVWQSIYNSHIDTSSTNIIASSIVINDSSIPADSNTLISSPSIAWVQGHGAALEPPPNRMAALHLPPQPNSREVIVGRDFFRDLMNHGRTIRLILRSHGYPGERGEAAEAIGWALHSGAFDIDFVFIEDARLS